jgi:hypothetical protein
VQILRRLPFRDVPSTVEVVGETVEVRAYQIIVWVSLGVGGVLGAEAPRFPAVLDTGHSHNVSLQEHQLDHWAGLPLETLERLGTILVNRQEVPLGEADLWIHRNRPGSPTCCRIPTGSTCRRESPSTSRGRRGRRCCPCWDCGAWSATNST